MKVRVKDIAAKAKVSPATVSNALNHKPGVSEKVTERIMKIAAEMGYEPPKDKSEPNHQYIRLVVYKSHGLVVMDTQFFAELIESIQRECRAENLELMITHLHAKDSDLAARGAGDPQRGLQRHFAARHGNEPRGARHVHALQIDHGGSG